MKRNNRTKAVIKFVSTSIVLSLVAVFIYEGVNAQKSEPSKLPRPIYAQALTAYGAKNYDQARELGVKSARLEGRNDKSFLAFIYYWVARVDSIRKKPDQAFENLEKAVSFGFGSEGESDGLAEDSQFEILHSNPKWKGLIEKSNANFIGKAEPKSESNEDNPAIKAIFEEDQKDRIEMQSNRTSTSMKQVMIELFMADEKRVEQVKLLVKADKLITLNDFRAAAFVLQHSPESDDIGLANDLAQKGFDLAKDDEERCKIGWILAATKDRYLWFQGKPQIYGTQSRPANVLLEEIFKTFEAFKNEDTSKIDLDKFDQSVPMTNEPFDKTEVTNEERKKLCIPLVMRIKSKNN